MKRNHKGCIIMGKSRSMRTTGCKITYKKDEQNSTNNRRKIGLTLTKVMATPKPSSDRTLLMGNRNTLHKHVQPIQNKSGHQRMWKLGDQPEEVPTWGASHHLSGHEKLLHYVFSSVSSRAMKNI